MKIVSIGGGPAGLYYAILAKKADPARQVVVHERNRAGDTFGFGVVFSDQTLDNLARADAASHAEIAAAFTHWEDIDVHWKGEVVRSRGHGFAGLERRVLLDILTRRAIELGVEVRFASEIADPRQVEADLILGADGVNSTVRQVLADTLQPSIDWRPNRFVWLGTTLPLAAFTFFFRENAHGLFRVHAYQFSPELSTFIVECTEATWRAAGMDRADEDATIAYLESTFTAELSGHRLLKNRSLWRQFPTVKLARWSTGNTVLVGDAAHTAHFSIGSGTKLALEDAIALHEAIEASPGDIPAALAAYEVARQPMVDKLQRAAQVSLEWFEGTERYRDLGPLGFTMSLLTRSLRVSHANLAKRDPELIARVDAEFSGDSRPPMLTPYTIRQTTFDNRVVLSPMCQYCAVDGVVNDWHLVHLGSRAIGGSGLVFTEMTDVTPEGRITPGCAGLWNTTQRDAWKRIVDFVHQQTPAKIGVQLAHAGRKSGHDVPTHGATPIPGWDVLGPSALAFDEHSTLPRALDRAGMERIREAFVHSTRLALEAGFDVIELHGAHGYLLASFLSPLTNLRDDEYGGSLENRVRYPAEIVSAVRAAWGDRPLFVRISATDWAPGGTTPDDAVAISRALVAAGADLIDVSGGGTVAHQKVERGYLAHALFADKIRHEAQVPIMVVGGVYSGDDVNSLLVAGRADLVAVAREQMVDPYFTRHAAIEQGAPIAWPTPYHRARTTPLR